MSRIEKLLLKHCPDGVEYRLLGEVLRNLDSKRRPVTRSARAAGSVPYFGANGIQDYVDDFLFDGTFLLMGEDGSVVNPDGSPVLNWATGRMWVNNHAHVLASRNEEVDLRFAFYYLQTVDIRELVTGSAQPKLNQANMNRIRIPVPPLEVQREIVRVLDMFQSLEAELEAELEARWRQYAHYRDSLLDFTERVGVRWMTLGEAGELFGGLSGKSKADFDSGNARYVTYMNVFSNIVTDVEAEDRVQINEGERQRRLLRGDILFTGSSESADECGMSSVVTKEPPEPLYLNSFCIGYRMADVELLNPEFAKHLFRSTSMRRQIVQTANGVTRFNVSKSRLAKVSIPVPPVELQERIAGILDKFEALVNDISVGLPAELAARRSQYGYYRNRLLTFEEAA
jgi:type I restriction enzyme S subunit